MQLVHVSCARFADVGKGNDKIRRDRGGQHHRRKASCTAGADGKRSGHLGDQHDAGTEFLTLCATTDDTSGFRESVAHEPNMSRTLHFAQRGYRVARQEKQEHITKILGGAVPRCSTECVGH